MKVVCIISSFWAKEHFFCFKGSPCHEDICFSLLARIMSAEAPRPSRWQICVVPGSPWRALTGTNTGLSQHVSAHMEGSLFIVLHCEENAKLALYVKYRMLAACGFVLVSIMKPVSSPGSTPAVLTWLQPFLHHFHVKWYHFAGHRWLICSDMILALCHKETVQHYGWITVPL